MSQFSTLLRAMGLAVTVAMPASAQDASTVLATVNGTDITLGHVIALQERLPEQYRNLPDETLYDGILEQLIQQTALQQAMVERNNRSVELGLENEMRAFLAGEFLATIGSEDISDEDIEAAYTDQYVNGEPEKEYNASHILVETEDEAKEIIAMLEGGSDFAELAKEKSTGPSGPGGGELGWFSTGRMVPEFEAAVLALEDGQVSAPVQTQFGWHVIKRNETRSKSAPNLEAVRDDIENDLRSQAIDAAIAETTESAEITRAEVSVDPSMIRKVELLDE